MVQPVPGGLNLATLSGPEVIPVMSSTMSAQTTAAALATLAQTSNSVAAEAGYTANTATIATTMTAASLTSGRALSVVDMTGTLGSGLALTLPTVAATVTQLQSLGITVVAGISWTLRVLNDSSANFAWTLTTNTGWGTLGGTQSVAQNTFRDFVIKLTSATAGTVQSVGTGTNS